MHGNRATTYLKKTTQNTQEKWRPVLRACRYMILHFSHFITACLYFGHGIVSPFSSFLQYVWLYVIMKILKVACQYLGTKLIFSPLDFFLSLCVFVLTWVFLMYYTCICLWMGELVSLVEGRRRKSYADKNAGIFVQESLVEPSFITLHANLWWSPNFYLTIYTFCSIYLHIWILGSVCSKALEMLE